EILMGLPVNILNNPLAPGQTIMEMVNTAGEVAGGIIWPTFSGREDEDVNDWVIQFEIAFTASRRNAGAAGAYQAALAANCLKGIALQWYLERKEAGAGNLVNWADNNNDNDLKHRVKQKFTSEETRRKKMLELRRMKQGINEGIGEYARR